MCSEAHKRTYGTLRSKPETVLLVLKLLTEGMSVRGSARLAGCHRDTVLRILKHAGSRSYDLLKRKLVDLPVKHVEADEIWTYVLRKSETDDDPESDFNPWGSFYVYLALEADSKLLLMPTIGKRNETSTWKFANSVRRCTAGRFQLTTDGFKGYKKVMPETLKGRIDFAQFYKEFNMMRANPVFGPQYKDGENPYLVRCGAPNVSRITTAHVERVNLSLRTFNKRFNRKTICFSKDEEYLAYSVYLFTAHYNFCRKHSSIETTPAKAAGVTGKVWSIEDLLSTGHVS